jgi:hypothetical protein
MNKESFITWLTEVREFKKSVVQDRVSNCKKVTLYHGDLDQHFKKDKGEALLQLLVYSKADQRENLPAKHGIPINGNQYEGTASYRQAVKRYMDFKEYDNKKANTDV